MSKFFATVLMFVSSISILAFQNCGTPVSGAHQSGNPVSYTATIKVQDHSLTATPGEVNDKRGLDGCSFQISLKEENGYERILSPKGGDLKIDPALIKDGMKIQVEGIFRPDLMDFCMAGEIFEVIHAEILTQE